MTELLAASPALYLTAVGVLGLLLGSFLNVVILRLPALLDYTWKSQCRELGETTGAPLEAPPGIVRPRSHCTKCGHEITALENIPVLSFLWLRGRCSACGSRISWRYPLVELLTAAASVTVAWKLGFTVQAAAALGLTWALIAAAVIDLDHQILPDNITLPVLWAGLLLNVFDTYTDLASAVLGAAAGYLSLWLVYHGFRLLTGKEGMGFGDFKLFGLFGAWLGWQFLPLIILLASVSGAILGVLAMLVLRRDRSVPIPFGPFLALAGWIALLWGEEIIGGYLRMAGLPG